MAATPLTVAIARDMATSVEPMGTASADDAVVADEPFLIDDSAAFRSVALAAGVAFSKAGVDLKRVRVS